MRNYVGGFHQFPTNIAGQYRLAAIGDVVLSGPDNRRVELDRFLGIASLRGVTDALYLGPPLSPAEAESWPQKPNMATWCLNPLPNYGDGDNRDDIRAAPPGFVIARPGCMMPVFLHYYCHSPASPATIPNVAPRYSVDAAVHLVAGLPHAGCTALPNGGYEISIGSVPFAAAIVELQLDDSGKLECSVNYLQLDDTPSHKWP